MVHEQYSLDVGESLEKEKKIDEAKQKEQAPKNKPEPEPAPEPKPEPKASPKHHTHDGIPWIKKHEKLFIIFLLFVLIFAGTYIRVFSMNVPAMDILVDKSFEDSIRQATEAAVIKQHVGKVNPLYLQTETDKLMKKVLEDPETQAEKENLLVEYKSVYFDNNEDPYLIGYDPYIYLRYARNILENGHVGETLKNGKSFDNLRSAPKGLPVTAKLFPYFHVIIFKIMQFLDPEIELMRAAIYLPLFFAALSTILVFFILRRLTNNFGGFFGGLFFVLHPIAFSNTIAVDTQVPSVFFSLLTIWLFLQILDIKKINLKSILLVSALILTLILYRLTWNGYYYIFVIIGSFFVLYVLYLYVSKFMKKEKISKKYIYALIGVIALAALFLILNPGTISGLLQRFRVEDTTSFFPKGYFMIQELQSVSIMEMIYKMGGPLICLMAVLCVAWLAYKAYTQRLEKDSKYYLFMVYWTCGMAVVAIMAQRFTLYFTIPFVLTVGVGAGLLYPYLEKIPVSFGLKKQKKIITVILLLCLIGAMVLLIKEPLTKRVYAVSSTADDSVYEISMDIKRKSSENAIINTWWDDGYFLEYFAERAVLFDGGTFSSPYLYWVSKSFTSTNANYSLNVFRMLDCGAINVAHQIADKKSRPDSIRILNSALESGKEKAKNIIKEEDLNEDLVDRIFCEEPPEAFVLVSEDIVKKFNIYEVVAGRDFRVSDVQGKIKGMSVNEAISFIENEYDLSTDEAYELYGNINEAGTTGVHKIEFYDTICAIKAEDLLYCQGVTLNITSKTATDSAGIVYPFYLSTDKGVVKNLDVDHDVTLFFYQDKEYIKLASTQNEIRDSFLLNLYFLNAYNIPQLELISQSSYVLGKKYKAFKINWD